MISKASVLVLGAATCVGLASAIRADIFVIDGVFATQAEAQRAAAETGGWALDTDFYASLPPGRFAVVRGPFQSSEDAKSELRSLQNGGSHSDARIENVGLPSLPANLANAPAAVLAALLGELSIDIEERKGGSNPCEPQEPYQSVRLSYMGLTRVHDATTDTFPIVAEPTEVEDLGHFYVVKRTGELVHMRACFE